jgi:hypothetical protein
VSSLSLRTKLTRQQTVTSALSVPVSNKSAIYCSRCPSWVMYNPVRGRDRSPDLSAGISVRTDSTLGSSSLRSSAPRSARARLLKIGIGN